MKIFTVLGAFLATASALVFFAGRGAQRKERAQRIPARKAAEMLQEAWADHHTRA